MIPYNPSSFNSNKTILEQILELKRWLQAHPSYEVFYSSENGQSVAYTGYLLSSISDPTNLAVGDVVVFDNATFGVVTSVDTDNGEFGCDPCISFVGPQGAQGPQGPQGPQGAYTHYVSTSATSGTFTASELALLNYDDSIIIYTSGSSVYIYKKDRVTSSNIAIFRRLNYQTSSPYTSMKDDRYEVNTSSGVYSKYLNDAVITNDNIKTSGVTSGKILTANGTGGTSWEDNDGSANAFVIQLTSYTGTLSADDLAIVNDPTKVCIIDYYVNSEHSFYFKDRQITGGWRFTNLDYVEGSQITIMWYIEIDGTTGSYLQDYSEVFIRAENINSYGATSGQVLMADGSNGASWQTPSTPSVEGTSVLSTGATSGQVLQADGNGGASWQSASGGTTLTKYTYTGATNNATTMAKIRSILQNAKGRVYGYIEFYVGGYSVYFNVLKFNRVGNNLYGTDVYATSFNDMLYKIEVDWEGSGGCTFLIAGEKFSDGTTSSLGTKTFSQCSINYYNDSEI